MNRQEIIADKLNHRQGRRMLAQAMVQPIRGGRAASSPLFMCKDCARYCDGVSNLCDMVPTEQGDCWLEAGLMVTWDEVKL